MSEIADILDRAADLIEPKGAWTQGWFARDENGNITSYLSPRAKCFCARGAIAKVAGGTDSPAERYMAEHVFRSFDAGTIACWNDSPSRKQASVVAKLRKAAAKARTPQYALKNGRV